MRSFGDLSEKHKKLTEELYKYERILDTKDAQNGMSKEDRAKCYVCVAHDFYQMDMEEEGERLILKAEKVCPGYFKGPVIQHQKESPDFDNIIKNLTVELLYLLTNNLRSR